MNIGLSFARFSVRTDGASGNTRRVVAGDRLFLLKQGRPPRGSSRRASPRRTCSRPPTGIRCGPQRATGRTAPALDVEPSDASRHVRRRRGRAWSESPGRRRSYQSAALLISSSASSWKRSCRLIRRATYASASPPRRGRPTTCVRATRGPSPQPSGDRSLSPTLHPSSLGRRPRRPVRRCEFPFRSTNPLPSAVARLRWGARRVKLSVRRSRGSFARRRTRLLLASQGRLRLQERPHHVLRRIDQPFMSLASRRTSDTALGPQSPHGVGAGADVAARSVVDGRASVLPIERATSTSSAGLFVMMPRAPASM